MNVTSVLIEELYDSGWDNTTSQNITTLTLIESPTPLFPQGILVYDDANRYSEFFAVPDPAEALPADFPVCDCLPQEDMWEKYCAKNFPGISPVRIPYHCIQSKTFVLRVQVFVRLTITFKCLLLWKFYFGQCVCTCLLVVTGPWAVRCGSGIAIYKTESYSFS